jgi:hypothetical protein
MGVLTSEVGYTSATTGRGDHEAYMDMWWQWGGGEGVIQIYSSVRDGYTFSI